MLAPAHVGKRDDRPQTPAILPESIPAALRARPQWIAWQFAPQTGRPKPAKVPISPSTGRPADTTDPKSWGPFDAALALSLGHSLAGVGFVFSDEDPFAGVDLDACRDPDSGRLDPWAEEIVAALDTYAEVSPSHTGVKAFLRGRLPGRQHRRGKVELYDRGRYFAVTGLKLEIVPADVRPGQAALDALYRELFDATLRPKPLPALPQVALPDDAELVQRAMRTRNGAKFSRLWSGDWSGYVTHSEADLALAQLLAFWTHRDLAHIDALFRQSGLMRPKWDEARGRETYGRRTIQFAVGSCGAVYQPVTAHTAPQTESPPIPPSNKLCTKSVSLPDTGLTPLVEYVRRLRQAHGRPVGLSVRQAAALLGTSYKTAARRLAKLVRDGHLVLTSRGRWNRDAGCPGPASEFDLPEFAPATAPHHQPQHTPHNPAANKSAPSPKPTAPPPHTHTPGGLVSVWHWSARQGQWLHFGACTDLGTANALAGRLMARRSGWWAVGDELRYYARGRGLRVAPSNVMTGAGR